MNLQGSTETQSPCRLWARPPYVKTCVRAVAPIYEESLAQNSQLRERHLTQLRALLQCLNGDGWMTATWGVNAGRRCFCCRLYPLKRLFARLKQACPILMDLFSLNQCPCAGDSVD